LKQEKGSSYFGFVISHDSKIFGQKTLYHKNLEAISDWIKCLKQEACNLSFDDRYIKGRKLGNGKFSTVFQCQNRETQEIVAVKQIHKPSLTEREKEFLREEI
jgi:serine/threonine protein kinase